MTQFFLFLFLAIFLVGGLAALWSAFRSIRKLMRFRSGHVIITDATIISSAVTRANNRDLYSFRYQFTADVDGEEKQFEEGKSSRTPVKEGGKLTVEYLADNPAINRLEGEGGIAGSLFALAVGLVCVVVAIALAIQMPELLN